MSRSFFGTNHATTESVTVPVGSSFLSFLNGPAYSHRTCPDRRYPSPLGIPGKHSSLSRRNSFVLQHSESPDSRSAHPTPSYRPAANTALYLDEILLSYSILNLPIVDLLTRPLPIDQVAPLGFLLVERCSVTIFGHNEFALRLFLSCALSSV
jgi:hypothetical protein